MKEINNGKKTGLEKLHCKQRCHTPSTKAPMNEKIQALVCHETQRTMKCNTLPPHHPLHDLERPSVGASHT
jgi:hypothetical protein